MLVCVSDPSTVTNLQVDNEFSTHNLLVSWTAAVGVSDGYSIQLLDESERVIASTSVPATNNQHLFKNLTPGSWYKAHVQTLSGTATGKDITAEGQTRKTNFLLYAFDCIHHTIAFVISYDKKILSKRTLYGIFILSSIKSTLSSI